MRKSIKNIKDLTESLVNNYEDLVSGKITEKKAKEVTNSAGKIISAAKANLEYNRYMKYKRKVSFLETI